MITSEQCPDCGAVNTMPWDHYIGVCESCSELRGRIVERMDRMDRMEFRAVQRALMSRDGSGADAMRRALGEASPEI